MLLVQSCDPREGLLIQGGEAKVERSGALELAREAAASEKNNTE